MSKDNRQHNDGSSGRAFTVEQKAAVVRVRKCQPTAFYDILGLEATKSSATESEIKKAYRKLSLLTHPDKNGYTGADEAFKMVARAFAVLSDKEKRDRFDRFGGDPDSRSGGGSAASGASPFAGGGATRRGGGMGGNMWEDEISPEDLFRQFFGGGMGGGAFGGGMGGPFGGGLFDGPGFVFNMGGGPGVRVHQFGGGAPRRRPRAADPNAPPQTAASALQSLLPLLLLLIVPMLSGLFSSSTPSGPSVRFDAPIPPNTQHVISKPHSIPYWVNPSEVADFTPRKWKDLDNRAERQFAQRLGVECEREQNTRRRMAQEAQGFFFQDAAKMERARTMDMPSCRKLNEMGFSLN